MICPRLWSESMGKSVIKAHVHHTLPYIQVNGLQPTHYLSSKLLSIRLRFPLGEKKIVIYNEHPFTKKPMKASVKHKLSSSTWANFLDHSAVLPFQCYLIVLNLSLLIKFNNSHQLNSRNNFWSQRSITPPSFREFMSYLLARNAVECFLNLNVGVSLESKFLPEG